MTNIEPTAVDQPRPLEAFSIFTRLPVELRDEIWHEYLGGTTPRVFNVRLAQPSGDLGEIYVFQYSYNQWNLNDPNIQGLLAATAPGRTLAATCREARGAVESLYPDRLPLARLKEGYQPYQEVVNDPDDLHFFVRFSGHRDVVVFDTLYEEDVGFFVSWVYDGRRPRHDGPPPLVLLPLDRMQRIGFDPWGSRLFQPGANGRAKQIQCYCQLIKCPPPSCECFPLVRFLRCFPAVTTYYVGGVDPYYFGDDRTPIFIPPVPPCRCSTTSSYPPTDEWPSATVAGQGRRDHQSEQHMHAQRTDDLENPGRHRPAHDWLLFRATNGFWDWYISYPVENTCLATKNQASLEFIRRCCLDWPRHTQQLADLDVQILNRLTSDIYNYDKSPIRVSHFRDPFYRWIRAAQETGI